MVEPLSHSGTDHVSGSIITVECADCAPSRSPGPKFAPVLPVLRALGDWRQDVGGRIVPVDKGLHLARRGRADVKDGSAVAREVA